MEHGTEVLQSHCDGYLNSYSFLAKTVLQKQSKDNSGEKKGQSDRFIEGIWVEILSFLSLTICIYLSLEGSFVFAVVTSGYFVVKLGYSGTPSIYGHIINLNN